jgi:hypothetical protein
MSDRFTILIGAAASALALGCFTTVNNPPPQENGQPGASDGTNFGNPNVDELKASACGAFALPGDETVFHFTADRYYTWEPGTKINVHFMDGQQANMLRVAEEAAEWSEHANIQFEFFAPEETPPSGPQIRISFQGNGYWSLIGSQAMFREREFPTMNFNFRLFGNGDAEIQRVVLHEFGHALGLWHEHQNPNANFTWNKEVIYEHYERTQGWDRDTVDSNIFAELDDDSVLATEFDPTSIMVYSFPPEFTEEGFESPYVYELSAIDKREIAALYPGAPPGPDPDPDPDPDPNTDEIDRLSQQIAFQYASEPSGTEGVLNYGIWLNAPQGALNKIDHVLWQRQHDSFREYTTDSYYRGGEIEHAFGFAWQGWGWVKLKALVVWYDGTVTEHFHTEAPVEVKQGPDWDAIKQATAFDFTQTPASAEGWSTYRLALDSPDIAKHVKSIEYQRQHSSFSEYDAGRWIRRDGSGDLFEFAWRGYGWVPMGVRVTFKDGTTGDYSFKRAPAEVAE